MLNLVARRWLNSLRKRFGYAPIATHRNIHRARRSILCVDALEVREVPVATLSFASPFTYTENDAATVIDGNATMTGAITTSGTTGFVLADITTSDTKDQLSILSVGNGAGQIFSDGTTVKYGGTAIGSVVGGSTGLNGTDLKVSLLTGVTPTAVGALLKSITFASTSENPLATRPVAFSVNDTSGTSSPVTVTVNADAVNDVPVIVTNAFLSANGGASTKLSSANLSSTDDVTTATSLIYRITTQPARGQLLLNGFPLSSPASFTQGDINSGLVTYVNNGSTTATDSFIFTVRDDSSPVGISASKTFNIAVASTTLTGPSAIDESKSATFTLSAPTVGNGTYQYAFSTSKTFSAFVSGDFTSSKTFTVPAADTADSGTVTVYAQARDTSGTPLVTAVRSEVLTVRNIAPTPSGVVIIPPSGFANPQPGVAFTATLVATDLATEDKANLKYSFATSFGGLAADYASADAAFGGSGTIGQKIFTLAAGDYTIYARVYDNDGGESTTVSKATSVEAVNNTLGTTLSGPTDAPEGSKPTFTLSLPTNGTGAFTYAFSTSPNPTTFTSSRTFVPTVGLPDDQGGTVDYTIYAQAKDSSSPTAKVSAVKTFVVDLTNALPESATGVTISTASPIEGSTFTATLVATDGGDAANLKYSFATGSTAGLVSTYAAAASASTKALSFPAAGTFLVYARVFDDDGGFRTYSKQVTVRPLPTLTTAISGPTAAAEGSKPTYTLSAATGGNGTYTYAFSTSPAPSTFTTARTFVLPSALGDDSNGANITVYAQAKDSAGNISSVKTVVVDITNVVPSSAAGITLSVANATINQAFTATLIGTDPGDQATLKYSFATSSAGLAADYASASSSTTGALTFTSTGTFLVYAKVFDDDGSFRTYNKQVTVRPVATLASNLTGPTTAGEGTSPTYTLSAATGGNGTYTYAFSNTYSGTGDLSAGSFVASRTATYSSIAGSSLPDGVVPSGKVTVYAQAKDGTGKVSAVKQLIINVTNSTPGSAAGVTFTTSSGSPITGTAITFSLIGNDPSSTDASSLKYSFAQSQSGLATTYAAASASTTTPFTYATAGTYVVYGRVFDKDGGFRTFSKQFTVTAPPSLTATLTGPTAAAEASSPTYTLSAATGGSGTYTYTFSTTYSGSGNLATAFGAARTATYSDIAGSVLPDDSGDAKVTIYAQSKDDAGRFSAVRKLVVDITNVAPSSAAGITVPAGTILTGATVTFTLNATDVSTDDRATLRYSFATTSAGLATSYNGSNSQAAVAGTSGTRGTKAFSFSTPGAKVIYARVFDDDGGFRTFTKNINVVADA